MGEICTAVTELRADGDLLSSIMYSKPVLTPREHN